MTRNLYVEGLERAAARALERGTALGWEITNPKPSRVLLGRIARQGGGRWTVWYEVTPEHCRAEPGGRFPVYVEESHEIMLRASASKGGGDAVCLAGRPLGPDGEVCLWWKVYGPYGAQELCEAMALVAFYEKARQP